MAFLHNASVIFADFNNILFDTDTFVIKYIIDIFKDSKESFNVLIDYVNENGLDNINYIGQVKDSINPLMDFTEDMMEAELCYNEILYTSAITHDEMVDRMFPTNIGKSINMLLNDTNLTKLYVYMPNTTQLLCNVVYNYFGQDNRVIIVGGDKEEFFKDGRFVCDAYITQSIQDVLSLMKAGKLKNRADFIVPEYPFNIDDETGDMAIYDGNGELMMCSDILKNYNIDISTISLPLI